MALRGLPDCHRIEVCDFEEYVLRRLRYSGIRATEHTREAHGSLLVRNHEICRIEFTLHAVKRDELLAGLCVTDNHLASGNLVSVKSMEWLSEFHEYEIADIHNVVNRAESDGEEFFLKPLRRRAHFCSTQRRAEIPRCIGLRDYLDRD